MKDVFAYWGCGKGPLKSLHAHIRILSGILLGCGCLLIPLQSVTGIAFMIIIAICWCVLAAMPIKMLLRCAIASFILFFPFLLLTPWMTVGSSSVAPMIDRFAQAGAIALRSTCVLFIAASTIATLAIQDVHRGLACLPIPRTFVVLIVQLINQTMLLTEETFRIIGVLRLRGASGVRDIRVMFSFPIVWMVRMLFRAERTAAAMTVRGYGIEAVTTCENVKLTIADVLTILCASAVLVASILMRLRIII
ncbi:MAG: energy-coupling factor transporter transmembrane component T [Bacteroidota bacterium]|jgi:energy-coupling factor transporter transmembrane protein EcfT